MRRLLVLFVAPMLVAWGCGSADPAEDAANGDVEQALIGIVNDWASAVVAGDTDRIEEVLADDFLATLPDGRIMSKRQHIEDIATGGYKASAITVSNASSRVFGGAAIVTYGQLETSRTGRADTSGNSLWTDVFVKRNGRWQIVAEQGTRLAAPGL